jgi:hypothetical protein
VTFEFLDITGSPETAFASPTDAFLTGLAGYTLGFPDADIWPFAGFTCNSPVRDMRKTVKWPPTVQKWQSLTFIFSS